MTTGLYLARGTRRNVRNTLQKSRRFEDIREYLTAEQTRKLRQDIGEDSFFAWAMKPSQRCHFNMMARGDSALVLEVRSTRRWYNGRVLAKVDLPRLGRVLGWDNGPWELVYMLDKFRPLDFEKALLLAKLRYSDRDRIQKPRRVPDNKLREATQPFGGSVETLIEHLADGHG